MEVSKALRQLAELKRLGGNMRLAAEDWGEEWKCLIATIMSAQSRDETTIPIAEKLFDKYDSLGKLANAQYSEVLKVFSGLNFNKTKARNVIFCAKELMERYNGKIPHDLDKLIELSGVGRKTANVFLSEHGKEGLAVDTHVYQIARNLDWSNGKNPHKVEIDLKKLFPNKYWSIVNPILVRFGKKYTSRKKKKELLDSIKNI
ncbi:MAG: endonuclease III domain-containing protein [Candidatus Pacearchaeota archaeon]